MRSERPYLKGTSMIFPPGEYILYLDKTPGRVSRVTAPHGFEMWHDEDNTAHLEAYDPHIYGDLVPVGSED